MQINNFPWPWVSIDDHVDPIFLAKLQTLPQIFKHYKHYFLHDPEVAVCRDEFSQHLQNIYQSRDFWFNTFPNRRHFKEYDICGHISWQTADHAYPVHDEHPDKVLSFISYIWPESNLGTALHALENSPPVITVDWRPGRTLVFAGQNQKTWHSYKSQGSPRLTVCAFIVKKGSSF